MSAEKAPGLLSRFPALQRLERVPRGAVPYIPQLTSAECAVACLAMALAYHGKHVAREELRAALGPARDGVRASALLRAAHHFGLRGRGLRLELDALRHLPRGSILHWNFNHFVVLQRVSRRGVEIVDPSFGPRRVSWKEMDRYFTGAVLALERGANFEPCARPPQNFELVALLLASGSWGRILATSFAAQSLTLALPLLVGVVVDRVVPRGEYDLVLLVVIGVCALVAFQWLSAMVRGHLLVNLRTRLDAEMTMGLVERMMALPYTFFQRRATGDLTLRMNSNEMVQEILTSGALSAVLDGTLMVSYLVILSLVSPTLGGAVALFGLLQVAVALLMRKRLRLLYGQGIEQRAACDDYQIEMLSAIETLKAMGCEDRARQRWGDLFVDRLNNRLMTGRLQIVFDSVSSALLLGAPLAILVLGALQVLDGRLSVGTMLGLNTLSLGILGPLTSLVRTAIGFDRLGVYLERIADVYQAPREQPQHALPAARLSGAIRVENLHFRYSPTAPEAIRDVSIDVRPGEFVAIVGRSGSGKSTLAGLLLGLYAPSAGRVCFDGTNLGELDLRDVRRQVGFVSQATHLFASSIRANIALANPECPLAAVEKAARRAHIADEIRAMPMGYNTVLSSGGGAISGGQRQRLALARALVNDPAVLVLDEATSALDAESERRVQTSLAELACTRIVIAHRLSTVIAADRILVLEDGQLVEQGRHCELLALGGAYARLVASQTSALEPAARG